MKYLFVILSMSFLIGCSGKADNQIYLRDRGYMDIFCDVTNCISVDSIGNVYYSRHSNLFDGVLEPPRKIYETKCK